MGSAKGRAEELFDRIKKDGEAAINEMIAGHDSESLFLDFKRSGNDGNGARLNESDWKNLAKAISGFGNSEGGVILWGVDCRADAKLGDVPVGTVPIFNPKRFVSWLEGAVSGCTVPAHPTVEHVAIDSGTSGHGFVATLIPKSDLAPHQCIKPAGQLQYYIRAGSNFHATPHAVLAGMFGRRPQASLTHKIISVDGVELQKKNSVTMGIEMEIGIVLVSSGPGVCRDVYLTLATHMPKGGSTAGFDPQTEGGWVGKVAFGNIVNLVLREGSRLPPAFPTQPLVLKLGFWPPFESSYVLDLTYGHAEGPIKKHRVELSAAEVDNAFNRACALLMQTPRPKDATSQILQRFLITPGED